MQLEHILKLIISKKVVMAARNLFSSYRTVSGSSWRSQLACQASPPRFAGYCSPGLSFLGSASRTYMTRSRGNDQGEQVQQPTTRLDFYTWGKWLLGSILSLLPFWNNLKRIEGNAAEIVQEVEAVAEVVEKVATTADTALTEVANELPDKSKLKEAAQVLEHVSKVTSQDAQLIDNVLHQVGDVKQDLEELETMLEPIVEKIISTKHPRT